MTNKIKVVAIQSLSQVVDTDNPSTALDIALNTPNNWIKETGWSFYFEKVGLNGLPTES